MDWEQTLRGAQRTKNTKIRKLMKTEMMKENTR
jgi:hypothetical protein